MQCLSGQSWQAGFAELALPGNVLPGNECLYYTQSKNPPQALQTINITQEINIKAFVKQMFMYHYPPE